MEYPDLGHGPASVCSSPPPRPTLTPGETTSGKHFCTLLLGPRAWGSQKNHLLSEDPGAYTDSSVHVPLKLLGNHR